MPKSRLIGAVTSSQAHAGWKFVSSTLLATAALVAVTVFAPGAARAQDATWGASPLSNSFNNRLNWSPPSAVPTGTAFFGTSNTIALKFEATTTTVGGWTFNTGASAYTFTNDHSLQFNGAGIVINSGSATINNNLSVEFDNNSTAGSAIINNTNINSALNFNATSTAANAIITNGGNLDFNATSTAGSATINNDFSVEFANNSTAGNATINNNTGGTLRFTDASSAANASLTNNSSVFFQSTSTAGNAHIINNSSDDVTFSANSTAGNATITNGGDLNFNDSSTTGNATINNNFGSMTFNSSSTAGNATISNNGNVFFESASTAGNATINNNHNVFFSGNSTGGNAAITNASGGAMVDFSGSTGPAGDRKLTAGSIAGAGLFLVGAQRIDGRWQQHVHQVSGDISGPGSLVKVGTGTLTLSGNATLGGTTIDGGTLAVDGGALNAVNTIVLGSTAGTSGTLEYRRGRARNRPEILSLVKAALERSQLQNGGTLTDFGGFVGDLPGSPGHGDRIGRRLHVDEHRHRRGRRLGHGHAYHPKRRHGEQWRRRLRRIVCRLDWYGDGDRPGLQLEQQSRRRAQYRQFWHGHTHDRERWDGHQ